MGIREPFLKVKLILKRQLITNDQLEKCKNPYLEEFNSIQSSILNSTYILLLKQTLKIREKEDYSYSDTHLSNPLQSVQKYMRLHGCLLCFRRKRRNLRQVRLSPQDASAQQSSNRYKTNWLYFLLQSLTHKICG